MLESQQRFRSKKHNVFTKEVNMIALSGSNYKKIRSIDSIEACAHGINKEVKNTKKWKLNVLI